MPSSLDEACKDPKWAEPIDREYNALVERGTKEYLKLTPDMTPLPYVWNFCVKDTMVTNFEELCKARCLLRGYKQI